MKIEAWFDGCCEPKNPGGYAGYGAVILVDGVRVWEHSGFIDQAPTTSNNVAEYSGFLAILEYLKAKGLQNKPILVRGDSRLVLYQMFEDPEIKRPWKMKGGFYLPYARKAQKLLLGFKRIKCEWIPREENSLADELSKAELIKRKVNFKIQPL
jgi:ribonuclease HI